MWFEIVNMPYLSLIWLGLGFCIVILGIIMLAHLYNKEEDYTQYENDQITQKTEELFSYFLEEEEKKNNILRKELLGKDEDKNKKKQQTKEEAVYEEIIRLHKENMSVETIAKKMQIGVGEVKLIISLYTMR